MQVLPIEWSSLVEGVVGFGFVLWVVGCVR